MSLRLNRIGEKIDAWLARVNTPFKLALLLGALAKLITVNVGLYLHASILSIIMLSTLAGISMFCVVILLIKKEDLKNARRSIPIA